jgi:hypothetical protein
MIFAICSCFQTFDVEDGTEGWLRFKKHINRHNSQVHSWKHIEVNAFNYMLQEQEGIFLSNSRKRRKFFRLLSKNQNQADLSSKWIIEHKNGESRLAGYLVNQKRIMIPEKDRDPYKK